MCLLPGRQKNGAGKYFTLHLVPKYYLCRKIQNMRSAIILTFAFAAILFTACKRDGKSPSTDSQSVTAPAPAAGATSAVLHYICPNNCAGSGGDVAGKCPVCGSDYLHNDAFHNQGNATPPAPTLSDPQNPGAQPAPSITPPPSDPPQNAAGVWHYICSNGCSGGSGTAGNCSQCGGALAHNAAYHQ